MAASISYRGWRPVTALTALALLAPLALAGGACSQTPAGGGGRRPPERLDLAGSDTLLPLATAWAEAFAARHPDVAVSTTGGGSGVGIAGLIDGLHDAALASRPAGPAEQERARRRGVALRGYVVARDAVAVIVHPSNPVPFLTYPQLRAVFGGRVRNWRELGGPDQPLVAYARGHGSGTGQLFREEVFGSGGPGPGPGVQQVPGSALVHDDVARTPGAIGYVGLAFVTPAVRPLPLARTPGQRPVAPTPAAVASGQYGLARPLYLYVAGEPGPALQSFLAYVLGPEGQRTARAAGYLPLAPE